LSALLGELQKTFASMTRDFHNADTSRGVFRHDILLPPPPNTPTMQQLLPFLQQHRLLAFTRIIDPMHVLENVAQTVHKLLLATLTTKHLATATALLREHTGLPVINNNNPSWRWRKVWSCWPVVWRPLLESTHPQLFDVIRALSIATAILYGRPETRNARNALLLFGAAYTVHSGLVALGAPINMSEHLLWPHMPLQYMHVDGYNASCERPEADWKRYKDAHRVTNRNAPDALKQMITRVHITDYVRAHERAVKDRNTRTVREEEWAAEEHSVRFVVSRASAEFVNSFLMYVAALLVLLLRADIECACSAIGRYKEGVWWHRRGSNSDGTPELELHTSRNDPVHREPALLTMASAARCTINDSHTVLHTHNEAPAFDPATGKHTVAPTAAAAAAAVSQALQLQQSQQPLQQQSQQQPIQPQLPQQQQTKSGAKKRKRGSSTTRRASATAAPPATSSTAAPSVAAVSAAAASCNSAVPFTPPTPQQVAARDALAAADAAVADSEVPTLPTNVPDDENVESAPQDNTEAPAPRRYDTAAALSCSRSSCRYVRRRRIVSGCVAT